MIRLQAVVTYSRTSSTPRGNLKPDIGVKAGRSEKQSKPATSSYLYGILSVKRVEQRSGTSQKEAPAQCLQGSESAAKRTEINGYRRSDSSHTLRLGHSAEPCVESKGGTRLMFFGKEAESGTPGNWIWLPASDLDP